MKSWWKGPEPEREAVSPEGQVVIGLGCRWRCGVGVGRGEGEPPDRALGAQQLVGGSQETGQQQQPGS